jgi:hypothetical protein
VRSTARLSTRTETSDSAYAVAPSGAAARCLAEILSRPRSVDELMVDLRMSHSTCSAAVNRLMRLGWVYDAGVRTKTRAGRTAIVWMPQDPPIPLREALPTRMELARRIKRAISLIERGSTDGISLEEITSILKGNTK